jgi:hypothetical protein
MALALFNPIANLVVYVVVNDEAARHVAAVKFVVGPHLGSTTSSVIFIAILAIPERRAVRF